MTVSIPSVSGYNNALINAGNIQNSGVEIALNTTPVMTKDWQWDLNFTYTKNSSKIVELSDLCADYITLQVMDDAVTAAVVFDLRYPVLGVVEEVQLISCSAVSTLHMHQLLAVQYVVRGSGDITFRDDLLRPQAVVVVLELHGHAGLAHLFEPASGFPCV